MAIKVIPIRHRCTPTQFRILCEIAKWSSMHERIYYNTINKNWKLRSGRFPRGRGYRVHTTHWHKRGVRGLIKKGWLVPILSSKEVRIQHALGSIDNIPFKIDWDLHRELIKELTFNIKSRKVYAECQRN